jgi:hypothetical protein
MKDVTQGTAWIGVDLDGTLAKIDYSKPYDYRIIGPVIPRMASKIIKWRAEGKLVKILTARAEQPEAIPFIHQWLYENFGFYLEVVQGKDYHMIELWDDRAVQVIPNTGIAVQDFVNLERIIGWFKKAGML